MILILIFKLIWYQAVMRSPNVCLHLIVCNNYKVLKCIYQNNEILYQKNTVLCPIKVNGNTIKLTVHFLLLRLRLALCYNTLVQVFSKTPHMLDIQVPYTALDRNCNRFEPWKDKSYKFYRPNLLEVHSFNYITK